jgi:hypothetical protein
LTWNYRLTCNGGNGISHFVVSFCGGSLTITGASDEYEGYGQDPSTGFYGIKFTFDDDAIDAGESLDIWFTLGSVYPVGLVPVTIKAGPNSYVGLIEGPLAWSYGVTVSAGY